MNPRRAVFASCITAAVLIALDGAQACGPDFVPETFVRIYRPDDLASFGRGQLGILQSKFDSHEYAVAYRYLSGGKLSAAELRAYAPPPQPASAPVPVPDVSKMTPEQIVSTQRAVAMAEQEGRPAGKWVLARAKYAPGGAASLPESVLSASYPGFNYPAESQNCPDPAFLTAVDTLHQRVAAWGEKSPWLADWIRAQDAVFSNCEGKTPILPGSAPAQSPALLHADRAYQTAAAAFYARHYDAAAQQFEAIAHDANSPWKNWGRYLEARALVRKAFDNGKSTDPLLSGYFPEDSRKLLHSSMMQPLVSGTI